VPASTALKMFWALVPETVAAKRAAELATEKSFEVMLQPKIRLTSYTAGAWTCRWCRQGMLPKLTWPRQGEG